jgi:hypothetical protein
MKTTVVYHSADWDGMFCREIARKFLPEAELIGWDFKDAPLDATLPLHTNLYVMDLPLDRPFGLSGSTAILKSVHSKTVWLDHHRSSIETHPTDIPGYRIDGVAACRLAWQWFSHDHTDFVVQCNGLPPKQDFIDRKVSEPIAVRLAGEYDIFDKRDPDAELFQHGLRSEELTEKTWFSLLYYNGGITVERLLSQGKALQFARANEYRDVITQQGFDVVWSGIKFLACNSHELDIRSHLFEAGIKPHHEALLGFTFNGKDWRVSMYHIPGKEHVDILSIAKKFGGGGHPGACGCRLSNGSIAPILTA